MLRSSNLRVVRGSCNTSSALLLGKPQAQCMRPIQATAVSSVDSSRQVRQAHAISNPTLANIEKRWEAMPHQEQADLWMQLRDRMKVDWHELTMQEKKAAYWIAFGPHGPRSRPPPGESWRIFAWTMVGVGASLVIFVVGRHFARPPARTLNKEWQEATNEYLKEMKVEPITGVSSEGYTGKGMVQSGPKKD